MAMLLIGVYVGCLDSDGPGINVLGSSDQQTAAGAVADVISAVGFEQEVHAFELETDFEGKIQLAHQPFLEVCISARGLVA